MLQLLFSAELCSGPGVLLRSACLFSDLAMAERWSSSPRSMTAPAPSFLLRRTDPESKRCSPLHRQLLPSLATKRDLRPAPVQLLPCGSFSSQGKRINAFHTTKLVPLIVEANPSTTCSNEDARYFSPGCLDKNLVKGKIVVWEYWIPRDDVLLAGAVRQIIGVAGPNVMFDTFPLPFIVIDLRDAGKIESYKVKTKRARAKIYKSEADCDARASASANRPLSFSGLNFINSRMVGIGKDNLSLIYLLQG